MQDNLENKKNAKLKFDHPNQENESSEQKVILQKPLKKTALLKQKIEK